MTPKITSKERAPSADGTMKGAAMPVSMSQYVGGPERWTVWDDDGVAWTVWVEGCTSMNQARALARSAVTPAAAKAPPAPRRRRDALRSRKASSAAAHRVDADDRAAVGGADAGALAAAAKADGATFVAGSDRARAHVRAAPPARRRVILPTSASELEALQGAPVTLHVAGGAGGQPRPVPAAHAVIEAAALVTSHDPRTFGVDPRYPVGVQERDYARDPYERRKVEDNAARLIPDYVVALTPDATTGPPVVVARGPDAIVMGGNSRAMSIRRAYEDGRSAAYRALLVERAAIFGIDRAALDDMSAPVLVRLADLPLDVDTSRALNEGTTLAKSGNVDAVSAAHRFSPAALALLGQAVSPDETLHAFLSSPSARPFVGALVHDRVISPADGPRLLRGGDLTDDGKAYVERALIARVLPDPVTIDGVGAARRDALARAMPAIVDAQSYGHDVADDLRAALEDHAEADRRGVAPDALDDQADFFAPRRARSTTPAAIAFRRTLTGPGGPARLVRVLRTVAALARMHPAGQPDLHSGAVWTVGQIVTASTESSTTP